MTVSIIIPTFNSADTIERCLLSVVNQYYKRIEVIIIDDGSTDNTKEKLEPLLSIYDNIKYIYQLNNGVSSARNLGIESSTGKYIFFLDSDDWISPNYISSMLEKNSTCDLIINTNILDVYPDKDICWKKEKINENILIDIINTKVMKYSWGKLYSSALIKDNNIYFNSNISVGEDTLFNMEYAVHLNTYRYIYGGCYYFYQHNHSTTKKISSSHYISRYYSIKNINNILYLNDKKYPFHISNFYVNSFLFYTLKNWSYFNDLDKEKLTPYIKKHMNISQIFKYLFSNNLMKRKIYLIYLLLTFKFSKK
ncbi:glycosyltransferase [Morganella morganii]|uniref:glycosyltransferase family 2 protein n=1 Tax=Morganella morganii TaxID=582 RepID=UPI0028D69575|nr:glycosyltransferase [Morganella morganii]WNP30594.1 glycosyltransferase [Morganella morganii]